MILFLALTAAFGCAVFNGTAAIFEKIGAGKEKRRPLASSFALAVTENMSYLLGIALDLLAWLLTMFARS